MGRMIDGDWRTEADMNEHSDDGAFERDTTSFRHWVGDDVPPAAGRYHLYVSYACPWAHRTLLVRALLGLEDAISVSVVDPVRYDQGWTFDPEKPGCTPDHVFGGTHLRDVYTEADPEYTGRVTVPVLYDTDADTIVNNESEEIMRMLDVAFDDHAARDVDLYPEGYRDEVDRLIEDIYDPINNGVYRAGFADSQRAYDNAVDDLFEALAHYDDVLAEQRYLAGDVLTEADVAMFTTLYRFDEVYHTHFKCNRKRISDYDNLWPYLRELCQLPGVADTLYMEHVKQHYYRSHGHLNPKRLVPTGPNPAFFAPHDRDELPGGPPADLRG
ncbi:glutathione S-transferase family protein [Halobacterium salinarum]|uniref:glutathione S-transferase family protein n=1 Tax=Halobacterium salinarum TaxID=2242 RepID=UPI001F1E4CB4|nr:glutathione S-transferase family protein [Halobacterium salinarum]MCF2206554.1 glutathione S-transferase family protein [Halobacterium salinarum]MCF2240129.1 glutathione S-transferase family protein [Halobacterium salinarum]